MKCKKNKDSLITSKSFDTCGFHFALDKETFHFNNKILLISSHYEIIYMTILKIYRYHDRSLLTSQFTKSRLKNNESTILMITKEEVFSNGVRRTVKGEQCVMMTKTRAALTFSHAHGPLTMSAFVRALFSKHHRKFSHGLVHSLSLSTANNQTVNPIRIDFL